MVEIQKMMEIEFLKEKTYTEINDMFRELNLKLKGKDAEIAELGEKLGRCQRDEDLEDYDEFR